MKKLPIHYQIISIFCLCLTLFSFSAKPVEAVDVSSIGIATYLPIDGTVENGDIIISTGKGYTKSTKPYDPQIVGVATTKPAIALKTTTKEKTIPVVNVGLVMVRVAGLGGNISKGDFITSSSIPGVGMKAEKGGYMVGQAMQDVSFTKPTDETFLQISLNIHFLQRGSPVASSLWDIFSLTQIAAYEEPMRVFKYVISAIVLILSFSFGFLIFSRTIKTGIEAIGRNPLAGRMIQLSILFNVILVIIIIMTGISIVYLFLRI